MSFVNYEVQGAVAILTINRPEALNALNSQVLSDLDEAITKVEADDGVHAVILTGAGRSFVAGADIGEMKGFSARDGKKFGVHGGGVFLRLENLSKPVIAAVNGFALGGGCELAMSCDIRLASEKAKFGQPEVGLGITPGFGGTQRLPRIVGISKAMELILTAKVINAAEAERIGLVSAVYPPEELMDKAMELANAICANAPIAVAESKRCIRMGMQTDIATGSAFEAEAFGVTCGTEDKDEGMGAFLEKRAEKHFQNK
ncbi:MAG: enoyl-CoA hydratase/isomerase family protein [Oscillospiraceae bacterium]|nr:enoyl-CoA hydratase/isomerase family protein [Oscillospiraceae bacterium]